MLDWLGFKFAASWNLNDERNVDIDDILPSFVSSNLADSFKEWLALDVADGAAYLNDGDVDVFLLGGIDEALNLVNDVRDDLDGFAKIFATSFFGYDGPIDLTGGNRARGIKRNVGKSLIMA